MKSALLAFFLLVAIFCSGQEGLQEQQSVIPLESALYFDPDEFNGRFAVMALSDEDYDYYVTDLSRLNGRFERIYFLNLSYNDRRLVNIDPDIEKAQMWFKAHYQFQQKEMICLLDDFLQETIDISASWTESEKNSWMIQFDKFKTRKDNDQ